MRIILSLALLFSLGLCANAQTGTNDPKTIPVSKKEVPDAVVKAYMTQNSKGATDTVWERQVVAIYKVKFVDDNRSYESLYFDDGRWIKTYTIIAQTELPITVTDQLKKLYPDFAITKTMIELSNDGKMYTVELTKGKQIIKEHFLMNGKLFR